MDRSIKHTNYCSSLVKLQSNNDIITLYPSTRPFRSNGGNGLHDTRMHVEFSAMAETSRGADDGTVIIQPNIKYMTYIEQWLQNVPYYKL